MAENQSVPLLLSVPEEIGIPVLRDARKRKITSQQVILEILRDHYQVQIEIPKRGRPAKPKNNEQRSTLPIVGGLCGEKSNVRSDAANK